IDADPAESGVGFVGPDDAVFAFRAILVLDAQPCAEMDRAAIGRSGRDHAHLFEPLAEVTHAAVDLAKLLLAIGVFGVLGAVALGCRRRERAHDFRSARAPQFVQLRLEPGMTLRRDEGGRGRNGWAPATHWRS